MLRLTCAAAFGVVTMRIALFTPYSPEIGGGSAQLRNHLRDLSDLDVQWHYLAPKPAPTSNEKWTWLGEPFSFRELIADLSARSGILPGSRRRARQLVERIKADLYWVVAHYEGIAIAAELCDRGKPVHLTVHDDPFGTWRRSDRYRWFQPLLGATFAKLLRRAQNLDVTSWGMRNLYREAYGAKCFSVYLHVPALPALSARPAAGKFTIGHIGTLYHPKPFRRFLNVCKRIAVEEHRELRVVRIGSSPEMDVFAKENPATFEAHGDLSEEAAAPVLATCDLLYAMYPPGQRYERFRKTSLPIKLSTYIQAQRPVFVHSPLDSGLARIVASARVGCVCPSLDETEIAGGIRQLFKLAVSPDSFEQLRQELMGSDQVRQLRAALLGENWQAFPENDFRSRNAVGAPDCAL
jgi:hypothetical protein